MKMQHLVVAAAVALAPVAAHADKDALKDAKAAKVKAMKQAAIDDAKKRRDIDARDARDANQKRIEMEKQTIALKQQAAEEATHQQHLGVIERLDQIAVHTKDAALAAKVAVLKLKEQERHSLAIAG